MSVVLQSGDRVHIVVPGSIDRQGVVDHAANARFDQEVRREYAAQGVTVVLLTTIGSTAGPIIPTVVAVFRNPPKKAPVAGYRDYADLVARNPMPHPGESAQVGGVTYQVIDGTWLTFDPRASVQVSEDVEVFRDEDQLGSTHPCPDDGQVAFVRSCGQLRVACGGQWRTVAGG